MGQLIEGKWHPDSELPAKTAAPRRSQTFCGSVRADGQPGPDGRLFAAEAGRYHLIVSYACPWAHRVLIARHLLGLEAAIGVDAVEAVMGEGGWAFAGHSEPGPPGATADRVRNAAFLRELYVAADPHFTGRVTVPVLWDSHGQTIVNNESTDLMRMLGEQWGAYARKQAVLRPPELISAIDEDNQKIQLAINQGVYRCGFAKTQAAYEEAFDRLFAALTAYDERLADRPFLHGEEPTESDWRLFVTLVRFDVVYYTHFRCNGRRIAEFTHLPRYLRALYQRVDGPQTVRIDHIKHHYFRSHRALNPLGLVPKGPIDWL